MFSKVEPMLEAYGQVSGLESTQSRLDRGQRSNICMLGQDQSGNWIRKETNDAHEPMAWEFRNMVSLMETGLGPDVDEGEGVSDFPDGYNMQLIDNGATIRDYFGAAAEGLIDAEVMASLGEAVGKLMFTFWRAENWVHGDLHLRNIVVGYERNKGWRPYIIDVSHGYKDDDSDREEFASLQQLIVEELNTVDDEIEWLFNERAVTDWALAYEDRRLGEANFDHAAYGAFVAAVQVEI